MAETKKNTRWREREWEEVKEVWLSDAHAILAEVTRAIGANQEEAVYLKKRKRALTQVLRSQLVAYNKYREQCGLKPISLPLSEKT